MAATTGNADDDAGDGDDDFHGDHGVNDDAGGDASADDGDAGGDDHDVHGDNGADDGDAEKHCDLHGEPMD